MSPLDSFNTSAASFCDSFSTRSPFIVKSACGAVTFWVRIGHGVVSVIHVERGKEVVHHVRAGDVAAHRIRPAPVDARVGGAVLGQEDPLFLAGIGKLEGPAAHREIEISGGVVERILDRLGIHALGAEVPEIGIARVDRGVVRDLRWLGLRGKPVGRGRHNQAVQPLHAVVVGYELAGEHQGGRRAPSWRNSRVG